MRIYKYDLPVIDGVQSILMPEGAQVLHIGTQHNNPSPVYIWALVDPVAGTEVRKFVIYGTGHPIEERVQNLICIGSVVTPVLVWHVFEVI